MDSAVYTSTQTLYKYVQEQPYNTTTLTSAQKRCLGKGGGSGRLSLAVTWPRFTWTNSAPLKRNYAPTAEGFSWQREQNTGTSYSLLLIAHLGGNPISDPAPVRVTLHRAHAGGLGPRMDGF